MEKVIVVKQSKFLTKVVYIEQTNVEEMTEMFLEMGGKMYRYNLEMSAVIEFLKMAEELDGYGKAFNKTIRNRYQAVRMF